MPINTGTSRSKRKAFLTAIATFLIGVVTVVGLRWMGVTDSSGVLVTLLLAPALAYALVSGSLTEVAAPGGWKLKFSAGRQISQSDWIGPTGLSVEQILDVTSQEDPEAWASELRRQPTVLEARLDRPELLCEALTTITTGFGWEAIRYLVLVDRAGDFHSMLPLKSIAANEELIGPKGDCNAGILLNWVSEEAPSLSNLRGFARRKDAVNRGWSRKECLKRMLQLEADALPILEEGGLIGIVERSALVTSIVADLPEGTEGG